MVRARWSCTLFILESAPANRASWNRKCASNTQSSQTRTSPPNLTIQIQLLPPPVHLPNTFIDDSINIKRSIPRAYGILEILCIWSGREHTIDATAAASLRSKHPRALRCPRGEQSSTRGAQPTTKSNNSPFRPPESHYHPRLFGFMSNSIGHP